MNIRTFYGIDTSRVLADNFSSYTATENCFFVGMIAHSQSNERFDLYIDNVQIIAFYKYNTLTVSLPVVVPVAKGQKISLNDIVGSPSRKVYGAYS